MKKFVVAALCCASWAVPAMAQHVHGPSCNHQTTDLQGTVGQSGNVLASQNSSFTLAANEYLIGSVNGMKFILNDLGGVGADSDALKGFHRGS